MEIALSFLIDNLGKSELRYSEITDEEIKREIQEKGLHKNLINRAKQDRIYKRIFKKYTEFLFEGKFKNT